MHKHVRTRWVSSPQRVLASHLWLFDYCRNSDIADILCPPSKTPFVGIGYPRSSKFLDAVSRSTPEFCLMTCVPISRRCQIWTCQHVQYTAGSYKDTWTIDILLDMASEFWDTFLVKKYFCSAINFANYRVAKFGIWRKSSFLAVENTLIRIFRADAFQMLYILKTFELEFIIDVSLKVNLPPL